MSTSCVTRGAEAFGIHTEAKLVARVRHFDPTLGSSRLRANLWVHVAHSSVELLFMRLGLGATTTRHGEARCIGLLVPTAVDRGLSVDEVEK